MKKFFLFLFLFSILFSYSSPPLDQVLEYNKNVSKDLFSRTVTHTMNIYPSAYGSISLSLVSPSIDRRISSETPSFVFWNANFTFYDSYTDICGCDFSSEEISYTLNFSYGNLSSQISETVYSVYSLPKYIQIPFSEQELSNTSAEKPLKIKLKWTNKVSFLRYEKYGFACTYDRMETITLSGSDFLEVEVEGGSPIYFLLNPVLKEQWYKNNHFDSVVASNNRFYNARILKNNQILYNSNLYNFTIAETTNSLRDIYSYWINSNDSFYSEDQTIATPFPLNNNDNSFAFVYTFNSTYEGLGKNNLTLILVDFFGKNYSFSSEILSTQLTYNQNVSETGETINPENESYRQSTSFEIQNLTQIFIPASIISVLFIAVFLRFRTS